MQLTEEKQLQKTLEASLQKKQGTVQSTMNLQRELPVKPLIVQYLLDLEKAELLSGTKLLNVGISDGDVNALIQTPAAVDVQQTAETTSAEDPNAVSSDAGAQVQVQTGLAQNAAAAAGMKRIIFNLSVTARSYEDMLAFVDRIEKLKRISRVDSLTFSGGKSESEGSASTAGNSMKFEVSVSTFFLDGMEGLDGELPWQEYPKPAGKRNPLPQN